MYPVVSVERIEMMNNPVKTLVVVFLITLIVFVGVATLPVQADAATIAFYRPYILST